jgi:hypothetical protein
MTAFATAVIIPLYRRPPVGPWGGRLARIVPAQGVSSAGRR